MTCYGHTRCRLLGHGNNNAHTNTASGPSMSFLLLLAALSLFLFLRTKWPRRFIFEPLKKLWKKGGHGWREKEQDESIFYFVVGLLLLLLLGGGSGSFSLNGDGDVSRYPMLMSVFHGRSGAPLSLSFFFFFCLSLSIFFQKSSIVLSVYSFTAFCLMMKCWFWNIFLTPFFIYKHKPLRQV